MTVDKEMLRAQAVAAAARLAETCSGCDDTGWSEDENWSPEDLRSWDGTRSEGDGLNPCGFCNPGDWSKDVGEFEPDHTWEGRLDWRVSEFIDACSPAVVLELLDEIERLASP